MMGVGVCAVTGAFVSQGGVQPELRLTLQKSAESLAANASDSSVGTRSERAERQRKRDVSTATHASMTADECLSVSHSMATSAISHRPSSKKSGQAGL